MSQALIQNTPGLSPARAVLVPRLGVVDAENPRACEINPAAGLIRQGHSGNLLSPLQAFPRLPEGTQSPLGRTPRLNHREVAHLGPPASENEESAFPWALPFPVKRDIPIIGGQSFDYIIDSLPCAGSRQIKSQKRKETLFRRGQERPGGKCEGTDAR